MKRKNYAYIDVLNILACICVIGMHCNGIVHRFELVPAWWRSLLVEVLGYWAVPGFCMISGATMMNYRQRYETRTFIKRRLMKVGIPLIFWTAVFYTYKRLNGSIQWAGMRDFINLLLNFRVESVYWFFGPLLMIYASLPVLSKLSEYRKLLEYMIGFGVITISVLPFVCNLLGLTFNGHFTFPLTGGYCLYALIGYYLHTTKFRRWQRGVIYFCGIAGAALRYFHTGLTFAAQGTASTLTWGYMNLPALMLAVAVFVFVQTICEHSFFQKEAVYDVLQKMASGSFGVFLIHIFVMNFLTARLSIDVYGLMRQFIFPFVVYGICLVIVRIVQQSKLGKYIFP